MEWYIDKKRNVTMVAPVMDEAYPCMGFAGSRDMFSLVE